MVTSESLQKALCKMLCSDVIVRQRGDLLTVSLPLLGRDGDAFTAYLEQVPAGWKISDLGNTMMRLSYENDLSKLLTGARVRLYETILAENGLTDDDGEIFLTVPAEQLGRGLFALGQGLSRVEDIALWTRSRVESTFYDDLRRVLCGFIPRDKLEENYLVPGLPGAENYPIDYCIHTGGRPLYLFGVNNKDKARLATIVLQYLQQSGKDFESMAVCSDIDSLPSQDRHRLMNAANDVVPSIGDSESIRQKIAHRMRA